MAKLSFKVSWLENEEMFLVQRLCDNVVKEEYKFVSHSEAMVHISNIMSMCLTCQETWVFNY